MNVFGVARSDLQPLLENCALALYVIYFAPTVVTSEKSKSFQELVVAGI